MDNRWDRDEVHGITTLICDSEYDPSQERPPFLVEGIVHRSMTLIIGKPEGGKSTLVRTIIAGLANGSAEILGKPVLTEKLKAAVIAADPDSAYEYAEQFKELLDAGVAVPVHCPDLPVATKTWDEMHSKAARDDYQLVVIDNLWQFLPGGDLDNPAAIQEFYHQLRWFDNHDIAVILLAHSTVKRAVSNSALGHTTIHAGPRWTIQVEGRGESPVRRLKFSGNPREGKSWELLTTLDGAMVVPAAVVPADEVATRRRDRDLLAKLQERSDWPSQKAAATALGTTQPTVSRLLDRNDLTLNHW